MKKKLFILVSLIFVLVSNMKADDFILRCEGRTFFCFSSAATWDPSLQKHIIDLNQCSLLLGEVLCVAPPYQVQVSWIAPDCEGTIGGGGGGNNANYASSIVSITTDPSWLFIRGTQRPITLESTVFDCSGWVYFVLLQAAPAIATAICSDGYINVAKFIDYTNSHCNGIRAANPQIGDLILWEGHIEIVVSVNGNAITMSGSNGSNGSSVPKISGEGGWLTVGSSALENFGDGDFLGFFTLCN
jgi:hypothetical protein